MSGMKRAVGVRWWHDDSKRFGVFLGNAGLNTGVRIEKTALFPELVDAIFGFGRIVGFEEFLVHVVTL